MRPQARQAGLLVRELPDETLVYDLERHQAHCLNRSAGLVFRLCDGSRTSREIAAALDGGTDDEREAAVRLALAQLREAGLLLGAAAPVQPEAGTPSVPKEDLSRRALLRRVGTALLLPAVASVLAPTPSQAASLCVYGFPGADECPLYPNGTPCWCTQPPPSTDCQTHSCQGGVCTPVCS